MDQKEDLKKGMDDKMAGLFEQAHRDPALKSELLHDPRAVAKKYGVDFTEDEVVQLKNLGAVMELADDIKFGRLYRRPPIFYPIQIWRIKELLDIFTHLIPGGGVSYAGPGPIFYPAWEFGQMPAFAARAYHPKWVGYPADDQGGGGTGSVGGVIGGGVVPGPIFYPASLRSFLKWRLQQILQDVQQFNR